MDKEIACKDSIDLGEPCMFIYICKGFYKGNCTEECYRPPILRPEDFGEEPDMEPKPL